MCGPVVPASQPPFSTFFDQIFIPMRTMRHCTIHLHRWKVGETNVEDLLMKESIRESHREIKMTSKVGIRREVLARMNLQEQQVAPNVRPPTLSVVMYDMHKFIKEELSLVDIPC